MANLSQRLGKELLARAERVAGETFAALPADVRRLAERTVVRYETAVARHWLEDGVEPDSLGLFSGPSVRDDDFGLSEEPPVVTLFLGNLWDYAGRDKEVFDEEVERTLLHELGHFLGFGEEDMAPRDLD